MDARRMIVFALISGVGAFIWCYVISLEEGWMEWPEVFLSSAINYQPASSIGTLGLTMAIYMLPPVAFVRYCMIEDRTEGLVMNKVALGCSLLSSFGALLVAAFQASSQIDVHLTGAGIFFAFSLFLVLSQSYLDFRTRSIAPLNTGAYLRLLLAVAAVGSLGALAMYGLIILVKYDKGNFPRSFLGPMSVLELMFFGVCMLVYGTFVPDMGEWRLRISAVKISARNLSGEGAQQMNVVV